jgi:endonuclease YncB( thermonuclease family)
LSRSLVYEMLHFFRSFPLPRDLDQVLADLTWTHCRTLLAVRDDEARAYYARQVQEHGWSVRQLTEQIREQAHAQRPPRQIEAAAQDMARGTPLQAKRGLLHTYRLVPVPAGWPGDEAALIDLGFSIHLPAARVGADVPADPDPTARYTSTNADGAFRLERTDDARARNYTYTGLIESIIDGDTLWAYVDCGFGVWVRQKLRLRGIDCPELRTARGQRARDYVVEQLSRVDFVALTTTRPDKYDRYLADIFYLAGQTDPHAVLRQGSFLNRDLLNQGLAVRMTG